MQQAGLGWVTSTWAASVISVTLSMSILFNGRDKSRLSHQVVGIWSDDDSRKQMSEHICDPTAMFYEEMSSGNKLVTKSDI